MEWAEQPCCSRFRLIHSARCCSRFRLIHSAQWCLPVLFSQACVLLTDFQAPQFSHSGLVAQPRGAQQGLRAHDGTLQDKENLSTVETDA